MNPARFGILTTQPDARLAQLAAAGHERPFEVLVSRHRPALERYCRRLLPDGQAEDAVQQALWQAWRALRSGVAVDDVRPWLYAIARNQSLTVLRRRRDVEQLDDASPVLAVDGDLEARATLRTAFNVLGRMRGAQREALVRTAFNGESQDVIARDLGLSGGAVRQLVHRARVELRAAAGALVPYPLIEWLTAGGASSVAPVALRGGAAVVAVGAAITAAPAVVHHHQHAPAPRVARAAAAAPRESVPRRATTSAARRAARPAPPHPTTSKGHRNARPAAARTIHTTSPRTRLRPVAAPGRRVATATQTPTGEGEHTPAATPSAPADERRPATTTPVAAPAPVTSGQHHGGDDAPPTATTPTADPQPVQGGDDKGAEQSAGSTATQTDDSGGGRRGRDGGGSDDAAG